MEKPSAEYVLDVVESIVDRWDKPQRQALAIGEGDDGGETDGGGESR